jgi:transposase
MREKLIISFRSEELEELGQRVERRELCEGDWRLIQGVVQFVIPVLKAAEEMRINLRRLQRLLFGSKTEKSRRDKEDPPSLDGDGPSSGPAPGSDADGPTHPSRSSENAGRTGGRSGHGRIRAEAYRQAETIPCSHAELQTGQTCPQCQKGTLYTLKKPAVEIRLIGNSLLSAHRYELERLRSSGCGTVLTAPLPPEAPQDKYDARAKAAVAVLKYGYGMPFHRLEQFEGHLGVPLPAATQWELVEQVADAAFPVYRTLRELASQAAVFYADDSPIRILSLVAENQSDPPPKRKGMQTTAMVADLGDHSVYLYESGRSHAGENLGELMEKRPAGLPPPIQMTDALVSNVSHPVKVHSAFCLAHSRRKFYEIREFFPEVCQRVLQEMAWVYDADSVAKSQALDAQQRLAYHQQHSGPVLERLKAWLHEQWGEQEIEPNSSLGKAVNYLLVHWEKLTGFLRIPGCPIDNNRAEQALKTPILNRKNAYFFKTQAGAAVGSVLMSLVRTCSEAGANPVEYLAALVRNAGRVRKQPQLWLPWNYLKQQVG